VARLNKYVINKKSSQLIPQMGQYRCLLYLKGIKGISQKDLAHALEIKPASLSELLRKLDSKGFISREPLKADKRITMVSLSAAGNHEVDAYRARRKEEKATLLADLSADEKEQFFHILEKIKKTTTKESCNDNESIK
jgi:DNA-binding MarR family transcriptional regulator